MTRPWASGSGSARALRTAATRELVVPRSIPTARRRWCGWGSVPVRQSAVGPWSSRYRALPRRQAGAARVNRRGALPVRAPRGPACRGTAWRRISRSACSRSAGIVPAGGEPLSSSAGPASERRFKAATPSRSALSLLAALSSSSRSCIWCSRNAGSCTVASSGRFARAGRAGNGRGRLGLSSVWVGVVELRGSAPGAWRCSGGRRCGRSGPDGFRGASWRVAPRAGRGRWRSPAAGRTGRSGRCSRRASDVEAFAAAALAAHVGVVELEAFVQPLAGEVQFGAVQVARGSSGR